MDVKPAPSPRSASGVFWRVHLALMLAISLGIAGLTLAYRYFSGEWSRSGVVLGAVMIGTGGLAWLLRPKGPRA